MTKLSYLWKIDVTMWAECLVTSNILLHRKCQFFMLIWKRHLLSADEWVCNNRRNMGHRGRTWTGCWQHSKQWYVCRNIL